MVWGICGNILGAKLQKLQNRAARALPFSNYDTSSDHRFELLGYKNLDCQREVQKDMAY